MEPSEGAGNDPSGLFEHPNRRILSCGGGGAHCEQGDGAPSIMSEDILRSGTSTCHQRHEPGPDYHDALLSITSFVSIHLLTASDIDGAIHEALARLGETTDASRVFVCENHESSDGDLLMSRRYEWYPTGTEDLHNWQDLQNRSYARSGFGRWRDILSLGQPVACEVESLPEFERAALRDQGVVSALAVPIFTIHGWWGWMGLDECRSPREWTPGEVDAVRTAAASVGAAIDRARSEEAMQQINCELEAYVHQRTRALQEEVIERGRTEEARRRLAAAAEHAAESIMVVAPDGEIVYVNPAFERVTGYDAEVALGKKPSLVKSGRQDDAFYAHLWTTISTGEIWTGRFVNKRADGSLYLEDATISPIPAPDGGVSGYVAVKRDVTHEVQLATQLRQAQKMEAIGTLAGGIAHDFNNILSAVIGFGDLALSDLDPKTTAYTCVQQMVDAGKRAGDLVRQILTFSRETAQVRRPVRLQTICNESAKLLRATLPSTVALRFSIDSDCGPVLADPTQIHQILMNLCTNAWHAMRDRAADARLHVSYRRETLSPRQAAGRVELEAGDYASLTVTDNGTGMDEATLKRIFEPYFTTKRTGEGTGLGLATTHGIVKNHGGDIVVESQVGKGSTFRIYLPLCEAEPDADAGDGAVADMPQGCERVLLVDDEEVIADLGKRALERLGYSVTPFTRSRKALEAFRSDPDAFDLVITDLTMPHLPGLELAAAIHAIREDIPVILCTGFAERIADEDLESLGIRALLPKPVVTRELAQVIRVILDSVESRRSS